MIPARKLNILRASLVFLVAVLTICKSVADDLQPLYRDLPFPMPQVQLPKKIKKEFSLASFGGKGNGVHDNTQAFATAMTQIRKAGGGRLVIPRGIWLTGPIELVSHLELHVEAGALIKFIPDVEKYRIISTSYEGLDTLRSISPIYGIKLRDVAITGEGVIDGSGDAWRPVKRSKMTSSQWEQLLAGGGVVTDDGETWHPSVASLQGQLATTNKKTVFQSKPEAEKYKQWLRPVMVALVDSERILLDGPTFQNSPAWNIHILQSRHVVIRNLNVRNPWYSQNGDGLDIESSSAVLVYNNTFDVGDDAICIKSSKNEDGRKRATPAENIVIKHNVVYHAHGGFVVGSEMSGGVRNIVFSHATFIGTDIGIRFKSTRGRGGVVEKIWIADVDMLNIKKAAVSFNMFYGGKTEDETGRPVVDETTPRFRDIYMRSIRSINSESALLVQGLPEMKLEKIVLENAYFSAARGISAEDAAGLKLKNITLDTLDEYALSLTNVADSSIQNIQFSTSRKILIQGDETQNLILPAEFSSAEDVVMAGKIAKEAVQFR